MKRKILLTISLFATIAIQAQTAKEAFASLPEAMLLDLNHTARLDLIDLYEAGREAVVLNSLEDSVEIEKLTPDYLCLNRGNSSLQLIILQMINESKLYCLIHTVCAPLCDSRIEFYSVSWNKLNSDTFITNENFPDSDISLMQLVYDPETSALRQIDHTPKNRSMEDRERMRPLIQNEVKEYKWNGIRFE